MSTRLRVLGIDPGSRLTGFGVVELGAGAVRYVASGCVRLPPGDLAARLKLIYDGVGEVIATYRPHALAIEKVFLARNPNSALVLGHARGAAICAAVNAQLPVSEYTALQIKRAVVGKGHAHKNQVQHMVRTLLRLNGTPQADAADALACGICHLHVLQNGLRARRTAAPRAGVGA